MDTQFDFWSKSISALSRESILEEHDHLIGFPQAVVSMEHVVKPVKNVKIDFAVNKSMENTILERVSVL